MECGLEDGERAAVIERAERFESAVGMAGQDDVRFVVGEGDEGLKYVRRNAGKITGEERVPGLGGGGEHGLDSGKRSAIGAEVRDDRNSGRSVEMGSAEDTDFAANGLEDGDGAKEEGLLRFIAQESFVGAHAGALSACQYPSVEMKGHSCNPMVASRLRDSALDCNIIVRFCFIILVAGRLFAADGDVPEARRVTSVVRADEKSGRLIRSVVVEPRVVGVPPAPEPVEEAPVAVVTAVGVSEMEALVNEIAMEHGVEASLVHSVIRAESNYNPRAISPKGALGMMQLIPATAKRFGVRNVFDPRENVTGGVKYLKFLLDYFQGDYAKTIAAYNAGESAVDRYHGIPPYAETRNYVYQVAKNLKAARERQTRLAAAAVAEQPEPETRKSIQTSVGTDGKIYYRTP